MNLKKYYFISDVHLGLQEDQKELEKIEKLICLLDIVKQEKADLFILGDLFDYWFEYKNYVQKKYFALYFAFSKLVNSDCNVYYFVGNHDFAHFDFFEKFLKIKILCEPSEFFLANKRFFIGHGDGLVEKDWKYNILKKVLRSSFFFFSYKLIHPELLNKSAKLLSKKSRMRDKKQKLNKEKDGLEHIAFKLANEGFDYVVFGHLHKEVIKKFNNSSYINLGSWLDFPKYGIFDGNAFEIKRL